VKWCSFRNPEWAFTAASHEVSFCKPLQSRRHS